MHAGVGTGDARNRQRHVLDPAHVLARIIEVEHPFRDLDLAAARFLEPQKCHREVQAQREVLGQLVFANVFVQIRLLHVAQRKFQPFAGQQSLRAGRPRFPRG